MQISKRQSAASGWTNCGHGQSARENHGAGPVSTACQGMFQKRGLGGHERLSGVTAGSSSRQMFGYTGACTVKALKFCMFYCTSVTQFKLFLSETKLGTGHECITLGGRAEGRQALTDAPMHEPETHWSTPRRHSSRDVCGDESLAGQPQRVPDTGWHRASSTRTVSTRGTHPIQCPQWVVNRRSPHSTHTWSLAVLQGQAPMQIAGAHREEQARAPHSDLLRGTSLHGVPRQAPAHRRQNLEG